MLNRVSSPETAPRCPPVDAPVTDVVNTAARRIHAMAPTVFCPSATVERCVRPLTRREQTQ